ncbi:MAG TPA: DUF6526 family protein [Vicinamibacterales bacterium]|nr:DUF6526 family protein [Vicinamibacterales bacterium]
MAQTPQTYKNHARFYPLFHFFVAPVLLINFLNTIRHFYYYQSRALLWEIVVAAALFALGWTTRTMVTTVQDRIIRLEMRLRMTQVLPADLCARTNQLTPEQLVALRFASDAELADLVREVLDGKLTTQKEIKQRVRQWNADYLRA